MASGKPQTRPDRWEILIAVLIGAISILGAGLAGLAASAESAAGDAERAGLSAAFNAEKARASANNLAVQYMHAAAEARTASALAEQLESEAAAAREQGDESAARRLEIEARSNRVAAAAALGFVDGRYLDAQGNFRQEAFVADEYTRITGFRDRDYISQDDFDLADIHTRRSNSLINALIGLSLSVLFLTAAQISPSRLRPALAGMGLLVLACGLCSTLAVELFHTLETWAVLFPGGAQ